MVIRGFLLLSLSCTCLWSACIFDPSVTAISEPEPEPELECTEAIEFPVMGSDITIFTANFNGGDHVAVVGPGEPIEIALEYHIQDCACPGCIAQIEVGFIDSPEFQYCAYSAVPGCNSGGDTGSDTGELLAPMTPGTYYVGFDKRQDFGCGQTGGMTWSSGEPPDEHTFGVICVTP